MKYAWVTEHRDSFPIALMCRVLAVSRSGYYDSIDRAPSKRAERTQKIRESVSQVFDENHTIYGSAKITKELAKRDELESACRNTVAKAMRAMGLKSRICRSFSPTTTKSDPSKRPAKNVLDRVFTAERPDQKWVTDITYLPSSEGWVYLATVVDLFSRKVVGWAMSDSLATPLVSEALRNAIESRRPQPGELLHHSDRGQIRCQEPYFKIRKRLLSSRSPPHTQTSAFHPRLSAGNFSSTHSDPLRSQFANFFHPSPPPGQKNNAHPPPK